MKFYTRKRRMPAVIIVSLIDILAILLIFVIVTTTFKSTQSEIVFKLPESKSAEPSTEKSEPMVLEIDPSGAITFQGQKFTFDSKDDATVESQMKKLTALLLELKKKSPDARFALKG
ncbi:MAG: biopolymer transporter ExbD, partial [Verrucomicrobiota bacterium]